MRSHAFVPRAVPHAGAARDRGLRRVAAARRPGAGGGRAARPARRRRRSSSASALLFVAPALADAAPCWSRACCARRCSSPPSRCSRACRTCSACSLPRRRAPGGRLLEAGLPLTPENARRCSRLHPRCGTGFLLVVMIVAVFVYVPLGWTDWYVRLLGLPLVVGLSYELVRARVLAGAGAVAASGSPRASPTPASSPWPSPPSRPCWPSSALARAAEPAGGGLMIEALVEQIEARFAEAQAAMADPEVIADRRRYAEAGRHFNALGAAARLAEEWRRAQDDVAGAQELLAEDGDDPELRELLESRACAQRGARGRDPARDGRARPQRRQGRDRRDPRRRRRRRGRPVGRRPVPDVHPLRRAARLQDGDPQRRRRQLHLRGARRRRLLGVQVRGRHAPRAARPRDGVAGPHPHLHGDGGRAAGGRGGRRAGRPGRPRDRRLPLLGPGRPVGQHDRLGGADHAQADRHRRLDAGREVPAAEPRARHEGAARAALRGRTRRAAGRAGRRALARRSGPASARRRSAPTTSPSAG